MVGAVTHLALVPQGIGVRRHQPVRGVYEVERGLAWLLNVGVHRGLVGEGALSLDIAHTRLFGQSGETGCDRVGHLHLLVKVDDLVEVVFSLSFLEYTLCVKVLVLDAHLVGFYSF